MNCPKCNGQLAVNNKGQITCPKCDNLQQRVDLIQTTINDFVYYKIKSSKNFKVEMSILLPEDVQDLINKGVEVFTEEH